MNPSITRTLAIAVMLIAASFSAQAQLFGLLSDPEASEAKEKSCKVMYFDNCNSPVEVSVYDLKHTWRQQKGISALNDATDNWRMVREFKYQGKPAIVVMRQGMKEDGQIGIVEAAFEADDDYRYTNTVESLVVYAPTSNPDDSFLTLSVAKYVTTGESHFVIKEFRVDEETKEFLSDFYANEMAWKNASPLTDVVLRSSTVRPVSTRPSKW